MTNRAMESHAKINGWLEFLESKGRGDEELRNKLLEKRKDLLSLQENYLEAQSKLGSKPEDDHPDDLNTYLNAWDEFKNYFIEYHDELRSRYNEIRDAVSEIWTSQK